MASAAEEALRSAVEAAFPPVEFAMAYGSGVFEQKNHDASSSMIDLVFAVDDPVRWHAENLGRNPSHYSFLKLFGPRGIANIQENYGAGVYYNTLIPINIPGMGTRLIKYGVVSSDTLCLDLAQWKTLYLSGRMHKPVSILVSNDILHDASSLNLSHALHYSILALPEKFSHVDLFMKIAGISYLGDFRMTFGENPRKVRNIVEGNYEGFLKLYEKKIAKSRYLSRSIHNPDMLVANTSDEHVIFDLVRMLPPRLTGGLNPVDVYGDRKSTQNSVRRLVTGIVGRYSVTQSIKGIATGGAMKTGIYVAQKLRRAYFKT